jgi:hypothetical protein
VDSDGFVDLIMDLLAALDVMGREPATDSFMLEISVEPVGGILVLCCVTNETGPKLDFMPQAKRAVRRLCDPANRNLGGIRAEEVQSGQASENQSYWD